MITLLIRTVVVYSLVFCVVRLMGKRQISDMQPFDFVITLFIAELASEPISDSGIPLLYGVIPILTLYILHRAVSFISLKSQRIRGLVCGHSVIVIEKGVVLEKALKALNYTLNDLTEQLRLKDCFALSEAEFAILETNGSLSVLKKQGSENEQMKQPGILLLSDGRPNDRVLNSLGYDSNWLLKNLKCAGINSLSDCFFVMLEQEKVLHAQTKLKCRKKPVSIFLDIGNTARKG